MGNESSLTKDCKLEKEVPSTASTWRLYQARRKDASRVSVFVYEPDKQNSEFIENAGKYLKVLRHPSVIKFHGLEKTSDGVWLATEQISPLENLVEHLSSAEIVAGLYNVLDALVFLHEKAGLCHNNLTLSSVFVSADGSWRLGGVEYLCRFDQATASYLTKCKDFRDVKAISPEEKAGKLSPMDHGWARDVYSFGVLVECLLEYVTDLGDLTKTLEIRVQDECLNPDPNRRPKLSSFLEDKFFRNDFLQIVVFLKNLTLQSEADKVEFFSGITQKLYSLPVDLIATRLVHPLLSRFVLLDSTACDSVLPHLLTAYQGEERPDYIEGDVNPLLPEKLFRKHVIPELFKIFHVRDAHIRMVLLQHFCCYLPHFEKDVLVRSILPQILLGLRDSNDDLVKMSLHALAHLVPRLGGDVVIGADRVKVFSEATPKFSVPTSKSGAETSVSDMKRDPVITAAVTKGSRDKPPQKDDARAADRQRRREEAKRRNEERKKRRMEQGKLKGDVSPVVPGRSRTEEDNSDVTKVINVQNTDVADSDIDRQIEEDLEAMETTVPTPTAVSLDTEQHTPGVYKHNHAKATSKGALKLKSSKMRTSPPPSKKLDYDIDKGSSNNPTQYTETQLKTSTTTDDWSRDEETETWAEGGEDDHWNSQDWADMDMGNDVSEAGQSSSSIPSAGDNKGSMLNRSDSQIDQNSQINSLKTSRAPSKPKVADLDIMSLDIKTSNTSGPVRQESEDFFADMQPSIKMANDSLWGMLNTGASAKGQPQGMSTADNTTVVTSNFAVTNAEQMSGEDGWGTEDLDWGQEEL